MGHTLDICARPSLCGNVDGVNVGTSLGATVGISLGVLVGASVYGITVYNDTNPLRSSFQSLVKTTYIDPDDAVTTEGIDEPLSLASSTPEELVPS